MIELYKYDALSDWAQELKHYIHLIVTSPPYWRLKDYETLDQIGRKDSYEIYLAKMKHVYSQCYKALLASRHMCVVITDLKVIEGMYEVYPLIADTIVMCRDIGWHYEGSIIWNKIARGGTKPENIWPIKVRHNREEILIFRKGARKDTAVIHPCLKSLSSGSIRTPNPKQHKHPAAYPIEIPSRCIEMFSEYDEIVLDPFIGTGTTALAAKKLDRSCVGMDNSEEYLLLCESLLDSPYEQLNSTSDNRKLKII